MLIVRTFAGPLQYVLTTVPEQTAGVPGERKRKGHPGQRFPCGETSPPIPTPRTAVPRSLPCDSTFAVPES